MGVDEKTVRIMLDPNYASLIERPDWAGLIALHHGSPDREVLEWAESALKVGRLKCVVCYPSCDRSGGHTVREVLSSKIFITDGTSIWPV
jgi:hypothetical protein